MWSRLEPAQYIVKINIIGYSKILYIGTVMLVEMQNYAKKIWNIDAFVVYLTLIFILNECLVCFYLYLVFIFSIVIELLIKPKAHQVGE